MTENTSRPPVLLSIAYCESSTCLIIKVAAPANPSTRKLQIADCKHELFWRASLGMVLSVPMVNKTLQA